MVPNRLLILSLTVAILLFSGCTGKQKIENGNNKKMDASLRTALTESERTGSDEHLQVLIELTQPLDESMRTVFLDHNIQIESVVDHIITVRGTASGLRAVAAQPFVASMSLSQIRKPL
jgi:hypothetical protein